MNEALNRLLERARAAGRPMENSRENYSQTMQSSEPSIADLVRRLSERRDQNTRQNADIADTLEILAGPDKDLIADIITGISLRFY